MSLVASIVNGLGLDFAFRRHTRIKHAQLPGVRAAVRGDDFNNGNKCAASGNKPGQQSKVH